MGWCLVVGFALSSAVVAADESKGVRVSLGGQSSSVPQPSRPAPVVRDAEPLALPDNFSDPPTTSGREPRARQTVEKPDRIRQLLEQLVEERQSLAGALEGPHPAADISANQALAPRRAAPRIVPPTNVGVDSRRLPTPAELNDLKQNIDGFEQRHRSRQTRLQSQIEQLRTLLKQKQSPPASPRPVVDASVNTTSPAPAPPPPSAPPDSTTPDSTTAAATTPDSTALDEPIADPQLADATPSPRPITDDVVDRMALADNLYGAGKYDLALPIYRTLSAGSLAEGEQAWVHYQIAGCHRWLGQLDDAERQYRLVISLAGEDPLGGYSRWWLDAIGKRKRVQQDLQDITSYLQADEALGT